jgi:hypothetical protein
VRAGLLGLAAALLLHRPAATAVPGEYQVKAVFLFNFAHFVEWPETAFAGTDAPFVICIAGRDPFGSSLDEAVRGETIRGRAFRVVRHRSLAELDICHILFIDRSAVTPGTAAPEPPGPMLTVSDADTSTARDPVIRFLSENQKIRLRINLDSARDAGLTISSKLLRPAKVVGAIGGER